MDTLRNGRWITQKRLRVYPVIFLLAYLGACVYYLPKANGILLPGNLIIGTDFLSVYAAADLAMAGNPGAAYADAPHLARMRAIAGSADAPDLLWSYPPPFLWSVAPLAHFSYLVALALWLAFTGALCAVSYWLAAPPKGWWIAALAFPAVFINIWHGQNGFLSAALVGLALRLLRSRPWLAGVAAAALAFKPQLAVLLPIVFLAVGAWRALAGMMLAGIGAIATSYAVWGYEVWREFFEGLALARQAILQFGASGYWKMMSFEALARSIGVPPAAASLLQLVLAALVAAVLVVVWRKHGHRDETCALTVLAILLATPYSHSYDTVMLGWVVLWMAMARSESGFPPWERSLLALLWLLPLLSFMAGSVTGYPLGVLILCVAFVHVWRGLEHHAGSPHYHSHPSPAAPSPSAKQ